MKRSLTASTRTRASVDWSGAFLKALEETGVIARACVAADVSRVSVWLRRKSDAEFRTAFEGSLAAGALLLEEEAIRRARDGVRRIKFNPKTGEPYKDPATGEPYVEHEFSDTLMLALLKRHFPQYHDKPSEVNVQTNLHNHISIERQKELQARHAAALGRRGAAGRSTGGGDSGPGRVRNE